MIQSGKVYLVVGVTDMRKSIDGLSLIVAETLEMDRSS
ncbi:IS66 family insertion sequence element accessory protein TnpB [Aliivibrio salmonicida]